jgi:ferredoxin
MRAVVDHDLCIGCELCVDTCPQVFEMRDDAFSWVKVDALDEEQRDCAEEAADVCPVEAIAIEE